MFDIAFSELIVIAIIALIVIGPEKLPKVARTLGALTGRMQRYMAQIKEEVNREARFEELQKLQREIQGAADNAQTQLQSGADSLKRDVTEVIEQNSIQETASSDQRQDQIKTSDKD